MKKIILLFVVVLSAFCAVSCKKDDKVTVGILVTATHSALDNAKEGFVEALKANGYEDAEFIVKNPEGDTTTMNSMATELVRKSDIVLGIGTPAAVALQSARDAEEIDITVLFTAVTDPVSAGLMQDPNKPTDITGTNDMNPVAVLSAFCAVSCKKDDKVTVGILVTATHSALDNAKEGFVEALKANGYEDAEFIVKNPEGDTTTMNSMATELVRKSDIVLGIGTPAAVALQSARDAEEIDITVLFTAVTDPVSAGLMQDPNKPTDITGTNDMNPVAEQVDLILELAPGIKKIGVLYNVAETNSQIQAEMVKAQAAKRGVAVVVKTVQAAGEISTATTALIQTEGVEAIYLPTDNLIAANMPAVASVADELGVPTVAGESGMVAAGGTITYAINYKSLGNLTGEMAAKILSGTPCSQIPSTSVDASGLEVAINDTSINNLGIEVPQSIKDKLEK